MVQTDNSQPNAEALAFIEQWWGENAQSVGLPPAVANPAASQSTQHDQMRQNIDALFEQFLDPNLDPLDKAALSQAIGPAISLRNSLDGDDPAAPRVLQFSDRVVEVSPDGAVTELYVIPPPPANPGSAQTMQVDTGRGIRTLQWFPEEQRWREAPGVPFQPHPAPEPGAPTTMTVNGVVHQWDGTDWVPAPGLPQEDEDEPRVVAGTESTAKWLVNEFGQPIKLNPNYIDPLQEIENEKNRALALQEAGVEISPQDLEELRAKLQALRDQALHDNEMTRQVAQHQQQLEQGEAASELVSGREEAAFERERPFKEAAQRQAEETLALQGRTLEESQRAAQMAEQQRERERQLRAAEGQVGALQAQSETGRGFIDTGIGLGVAPGLDLVRMTFSPLQEAQDIMRKLADEGAIRPEAIPTRGAPPPTGGNLGAPPPRPSGAPPPTFANQSAQTRADFQAIHGPAAEQAWQKEHAANTRR